jgi:S1-C subfamily serine protease
LRPRATIATLATGRVQDGDPISVSGFPLGLLGLTTNSGYVANHFSVDTRGRSVILGDVRINGNSGGPAYSDKDGQIIGYVVEYKLAQEGGNSGLAVIIPAHEIATALEDVSSLDK